MTDASKGTDIAGDAQDSRGRRASEPGTAKLKARANAVRSKIATVVWLAAVVCALFLAVGALLIALKANEDNAIVSFIIDGAEAYPAFEAALEVRGGVRAARRVNGDRLQVLTRLQHQIEANV